MVRCVQSSQSYQLLKPQHVAPAPDQHTIYLAYAVSDTSNLAKCQRAYLTLCAWKEILWPGSCTVLTPAVLIQICRIGVCYVFITL